jgi:hypothetical protein
MDVFSLNLTVQKCMLLEHSEAYTYIDTQMYFILYVLFVRLGKCTQKSFLDNMAKACWVLALLFLETRYLKTRC